MDSLVCPYCERTHSDTENIEEKSKNGLKIQCGYCKKTWQNQASKSDLSNSLLS